MYKSGKLAAAALLGGGWIKIFDQNLGVKKEKKIDQNLKSTQNGNIQKWHKAKVEKKE